MFFLFKMASANADEDDEWGENLQEQIDEVLYCLLSSDRLLDGMLDWFCTF